MAVSRAQVIRLAVFTARVVVGGAFAYAGWLKANEPAQFIRDIWGFRMISESAAYWLAAYAPYLEIVAGVALITGFQRRGAHVLLAAMLVVFIAMLSVAWVRGLDISCGCFGAKSHGSATSLVWPIARDLLLLAGVAASASLPVRSFPGKVSTR